MGPQHVVDKPFLRHAVDAAVGLGGQAGGAAGKAGDGAHFLRAQLVGGLACPEQPAVSARPLCLLGAWLPNGYQKRLESLGD